MHKENEAVSAVVPAYCPTPSEIRAACDKIRSSWSESERAKRRRAGAFMVTCSMVDTPEEFVLRGTEKLGGLTKRGPDGRIDTATKQTRI